MRLMGVVLSVVFLVSGSAVAEEATIGRVKNSSGSAFIVSAGERRAAVAGSPVLQGDVLETGVDGSMGIMFKDESRLSLGPDTQLVVDEYVFVPEDEKASFVSRMLRGTLLYVSGTIAKISPEAASVETPVGTIGIRGTRFMVKMEPQDSGAEALSGN